MSKNLRVSSPNHMIRPRKLDPSKDKWNTFEDAYNTALNRDFFDEFDEFLCSDSLSLSDSQRKEIFNYVEARRRDYLAEFSEYRTRLSLWEWFKSLFNPRERPYIIHTTRKETITIPEADNAK